jgi:tetratricopeptide (TPR) repeat protein
LKRSAMVLSSWWAKPAALERETLAGAVAIAACLVAVALPWYWIPSSELSWLDANGLLRLEGEEVPAATVLKLLIVVFAAAGVVIMCMRRCSLVCLRGPALVVLCAVLMLPYYVTLFHPGAVKDMRTIYYSTDRAITDMEFNMVHQQKDWRVWQNIAAGMHSRARLTTEPEDNEWDFGLVSWSGQTRLLENLGYSNDSLNIAGRGWFLAILGLTTFLIATSTLRVPRAAKRPLAVRYVTSLLLLGLISVSLAPRIIAEVLRQQAGIAAASGDSITATAKLDRATFWTPGLQWALGFHATGGNLKLQLGCADCPEAQLARATARLRSGDHMGSLNFLETAARSPRSSQFPALRFWRSQLHTEAGVHLFNSGQYSAADAHFERALRLVPFDGMAWYGRAMVFARYRDYDRSARFLEQAVTLQKHLGFKRLTLQSQWLAMGAWAAYHGGQPAEAHVLYRRHLTPEAW